MPYNRKDAVEYARKHWWTACHDGVFWTASEAINVDRERKRLNAPRSDGWIMRFVATGDKDDPENAVFMREAKNGNGRTLPGLGSTWETITIHRWKGLADCANYLSYCIQAGGLKSVYQRGVKGLLNQLRARGDTKTLVKKVSKSRAQSVIDTGIFKPGDMIFYFNMDTELGDFQKMAYTHSAMYTGVEDGKGRITCHSKSRFGKFYVNDEWWLKDGYSYTLVHFTADDKGIVPSTADLIAGWWEVKHARNTSFYLFDKRGTVKRTHTAPKRNTSVVPNLDDEGYWFEEAGRMLAFWRSSGAIDNLIINPTGAGPRVMVNNISTTATKMF